MSIDLIENPLILSPNTTARTLRGFSLLKLRWKEEGSSAGTLFGLNVSLAAPFPKKAWLDLSWFLTCGHFNNPPMKKLGLLHCHSFCEDWCCSYILTLTGIVSSETSFSEIRYVTFRVSSYCTTRSQSVSIMYNFPNPSQRRYPNKALIVN